jgi:hypothetical protein
MTAKEKPNQFFHKKVYASIYNPASLDQTEPKAIKKIIPSSKKSGLREEFKKVFLPLLIDVFELRQKVQNISRGAKLPFGLKQENGCPQEILTRLTELQDDIEESRRWCEGVIRQIEKGVEEAKEALQFIEKMGDKINNVEKKPSLKTKLRKLFLKK